MLSVKVYIGDEQMYEFYLTSLSANLTYIKKRLLNPDRR